MATNLFERLIGRLKNCCGFSFRFSLNDVYYPLLRELTTVFTSLDHRSRRSRAQVAKAGSSPVPLGIAARLFSASIAQRKRWPVYMLPRSPAPYSNCIGRRTRKDDLLKNMIMSMGGGSRSSIHGSDVQDILASVPQNRFEDVLYFDPGALNADGLNMLK